MCEGRNLSLPTESIPHMSIAVHQIQRFGLLLRQKGSLSWLLKGLERAVLGQLSSHALTCGKLVVFEMEFLEATVKGQLTLCLQKYFCFVGPIFFFHFIMLTICMRTKPFRITHCPQQGKHCLCLQQKSSPQPQILGI